MSKVTLTITPAQRDSLLSVLSAATEEAPVSTRKVTTRKARKTTKRATAKKVVTLTCEDCGNKTPRRSANQKRCPECRVVREESFRDYLAETHDQREARKAVNHKAAAWMREKGIPITPETWAAVKEGSRNVAALRKLAGVETTKKATPKKQVAAKVEQDTTAKVREFLASEGLSKAEINRALAALANA